MVMPALGSVRLGKTRNEAAACLTATVLIAPADTYFLKLSVAVGDVVRLLDDGGKEIFLGSVHELDRTPEAVTLTAYDRGVYLTRNELYGVYAGTGRKIAGKIAGELGVPLGAVEDDGLYRTIVTGPGESAFSILRRAVGEGREIAVRDGALTVTKGGGGAVPLSPERVLEVFGRASMGNMVNRAVVTGRNGRILAAAPRLVMVLQSIRSHFAAPVVIHSAYRTPQYNAKVGGAAHSQHCYGTAADISVKGQTPAAVAAYARELMPDWGGVGVYAGQGFTHIDVRETRADWTG